MEAPQKIRPFLKWAGNKFRIIEHIRNTLPSGQRLLEPFVGSGAVFLNTDYKQYLLTETNIDLITLYHVIQTEGKEFIRFAKHYFSPQYNTSDQYYELRNTFNHTTDKFTKTALFIYLNKHCYNGLCRYNSKGEFNVPYGRYKKPYFSEDELLAFRDKAQEATFRHADFVDTMRCAQPGDVVYCDPPYVPLSNTANFTQYSEAGFTHTQQVTLSQLACELANREITVIISNHDTPITRELYQEATIHYIDVTRTISCHGNLRNKVPELIAVFN